MRQLTGTGQRAGSDRRRPKNELEEREREVMEHWSAAMAAIFAACLRLQLSATLSPLPTYG